MTSLLDTVAYPASAFAELYHWRWKIEEAFKRLEHRLALENTSVLSWLAAQQDFGAKVLADITCLPWPPRRRRYSRGLRCAKGQSYVRLAHLKRSACRAGSCWPCPMSAG